MDEPTLLHGEERERALAACRECLDAWGVTMPLHQVAVRHFGLDDFYTTGEIEFWIVNQADAGYCGKFIFVFDGQTCPCHRHGRKHETFLVMHGQVRMTVADEPRIMNPGEILEMPAGVRHTFTGIGPALLLEISCVCVRGDNFFDDQRIGSGGLYNHNMLLDREADGCTRKY